jgi:hypothetical protein
MQTEPKMKHFFRASSRIQKPDTLSKHRVIFLETNAGDGKLYKALGEVGKLDAYHR